MPQYTNSALEQELKKPERLPVGWPWRLLVFVVIIFGVTVATYLGMTLGYKPYLDSQIKTLDAKITNLNQAVDEEQQKNLVGLYSQLVNIQSLLNSHPVASKFFDFLEKNTHQQIYYTALNLSLTEKSAKLEGIAVNYIILAQQLELFRKIPEIEKVFLDDSRLTEEGSIRFSIRLIFKSELIH
jgi:hypothetical protein